MKRIFVVPPIAIAMIAGCAGKLYRHNELLGGNCRLVEPESKNEPKK